MDTMKRCTSCALEIPAEAKKCPHCHARQPGPSTFYRPKEGRMIAGVCAGIARELGIDAAIVRLAFAVAAVVSIGVAFWGYVVLWVITPAARFEEPPITRFMEKLRRFFSPAPSSAPVTDEGPGTEAH
jgi:phage shock protein C